MLKISSDCLEETEKPQETWYPTTPCEITTGSGRRHEKDRLLFPEAKSRARLPSCLDLRRGAWRRRNRHESTLGSSNFLSHRRQFQDTQAASSPSLEELGPVASSVATTQSKRQELLELDRLLECPHTELRSHHLKRPMIFRSPRSTKFWSRSPAPEPARPDSGVWLRAESSRDRLRDEIEQSGGLRYEAETIQRGIEVAMLQQAIQLVLHLSYQRQSRPAVNSEPCSLPDIS